MQRTRLHLGLFLSAIALLTCRTAIADGYTITDLGTLPGYTYNWTWQQAINNRGVVAAYANNGDPPGTFASPGTPDPDAFYGDVPYLWTNGTITPLPGLPGATDALTLGLNNKGQVVGRSTIPGAPHQPVLWNNGVIQALPELPGDNKGSALFINEYGQAVGYSANTNTGNQRAVSWSNGVVSQLPALPGAGVYDDALGINAVGQIVGWSGSTGGLEHIALWDKAGVHDLGTLGGDWGDAYSISRNGWIVGQSATLLNANGDAFLWKNGEIHDLGTYPGDAGSVALDINFYGQVVGGSLSLDSLNTGIPDHALLWENGVMVDLQTKIPANSGWTLLAAAGINDRGQIVGTGIHNGQYRNFVLTPK